jgi:protease-4
MAKFQAAGKAIHAYGPYFDQTGYLAAAAADDVSIDPMGAVMLEGYSSYNNYFKDALDKLGIKVNVFRVGEFKAAVEPFIRNDMSEEARVANLEWLGDLWRDYTASVAAPRKLAPEAVPQYVSGFRAGIERLKGDSAAYAKEAGLVTHLETLPEFRKRIGEIVGIDDDHGSFRQIHYGEYLRAVAHERAAKTTDAGASQVALIVVQGEIVDGSGEPGQAGGDDIADLLDEARRDDSVSAVVLRVDSPGGSAWASEVIRRNVLALKAEGKPVVASMGSVAASGGYWVAMDADQIWAHDSTITGSIGIFGLIPTLDEPLAKLGIHTDGVGTTPLAGAFRIDRPLSPDVAAIFQSEVEKGYRDFIEGVAGGRKLDVAKVESIAQGRVWSGADAKGFGLVDEFGGLEQAAEAAAKLAGLGEGEWTLEEFRTEPEFPSRLLGQFFGSLDLRIPGLAALQPFLVSAERTDAARWVERLGNGQRGVYAHCMCDGAAR